GVCNALNVCDCVSGANDVCTTTSPSTVCSATGTRLCSCLNGAAPNPDGSCSCTGAAQCPASEACSGGVCGTNFTGFTARAGSTCTSDDNCNNNEFCVGGVCGTDNNLCVNSGYNGTNARGGTCGQHGNLPVTYGGVPGQNSCGTDLNADTAGCATP